MGNWEVPRRKPQGETDYVFEPPGGRPVRCSDRFASHRSCGLIVPEPHVRRMTEVSVVRPLGNVTSTTLRGFTQRNVSISSAVTPSPHWPVLLAGRFTNGQRDV